jgi:uncharacterized protein with FMN-binding domain
MLRAVLALGGTAAGLAALLSFKTHPATPVAATAPAASPSGASSAAPKQPTASKKAAAPKKSSGGGAAQTATRTLTGAVENTQYGPMQVEVTLAGKRITSVKVLQQTNEGSESQQIDAMAIPQLNSETLAAQSAQIDAVSGASYTSSGYKQSLQSALDKA